MNLANHDLRALMDEVDSMSQLHRIIDATRPYEWRERFPAVNAVSAEFKDELDKRYATLLKEVLRRAQ